MKFQEYNRYLAVFFASGFLLCLSFTGCSQKNPEELYKNALYSANTGDWRQTEKLMAKACDLDKNKILYSTLHAISLKRIGKVDSAIRELKILIRKIDSNILKYLCAKYYYDEHRYNDATKLLEDIYKENPHSIKIVKLLAQCMSELHDSKGIEYYRKLGRYSNFKNSPWQCNNIGVLYAENYDYTKATRYIYPLYTRNKNAQNPIILFNLAIIFDERNMQSKAIEFYKKFITHSTANLADQKKNAALRLKILMKE